eukprot:Skav201051  [mRNA]  locus=scaffold215:55361:55657:+ [translate_table: standard]
MPHWCCVLRRIRTPHHHDGLLGPRRQNVAPQLRAAPTALKPAAEITLQPCVRMPVGGHQCHKQVAAADEGRDSIDVFQLVLFQIIQIGGRTTVHKLRN